MTHFLRQKLGCVGVDHVVKLPHMALLHQQLDHIRAALGHAVGELLDGDGFRDGDLADELFFWFVGRVSLQPLHAAAKSRYRALALFVGAERGHHGEPAAILLRSAARRPRRRRGSRCARTAACARNILLVGLERGARARPCNRDGVLAEAFLRFLLGLEFGLEVVLAAPLFIGLARFGGLALGSLGGFAHAADECFLFRNLALFRFAQPGVVERVDARPLFFFGQAPQHHAAGRLGGRRRCGLGGRGGRRCRGLASRRTLGRSRCGRIGLRPGRRAAFHLLHHHRLGAAMAEALAHHALLDTPPFQAQGLGRGDAQLLFASFFRRFSHSNPNSELAPRFIMFPPRTSAALPA